jgi:spore coat protein U-like protein
MRRNKLFLFLGISLAWLVAARPGAAQRSCTISTPTNVVFGNYSVYGALPVDTTGRVRINCNGAANSVIVDLSDGNAFSFTPRYMLKGIEQLTYNLFLDSTRTTIWGNNTGGTSHYGPTNPPNNTNVNITIYGRIPAGQDVSAGSYTDSITATVNF